MVDEVKDAIDVDVASTEVTEGEARGFWRFVRRDGDLAYFEVFAWNDDSYLLALTCDQYRTEPLLGRFVDPKTLQCTSGAWPQGDGQFGGWFKWQQEHLFICWPADRGGIKHHPEWKDKRYWASTNNPIHQYLEFIRKCLNVKAHGYKPRPSQAQA
jgi:hypothetical protein